MRRIKKKSTYSGNSGFRVVVKMLHCKYNIIDVSIKKTHVFNLNFMLFPYELP